MKKVFLTLALGLCFLLMTAFTSRNAEKQNQLAHNEYGRQCCSKLFEFDGAIIEVTACAGSFLTSDATAMTKACAKVDSAIRGIQ